MTVRLSNKILRCTKCNFQKKEWSDVTKHDIDDFVTDLMERYSDDGAETEYTQDHKKTLKSFFRWTKYGFRSKEDCINEQHGVGDPPETRHVKKRNPDSKLRASDLITDQEREWLLDACDHPMDAFLVDVSLDAGLRPGEIFNVTIGDIKQNKYGFKMDVEGKTGIRSVLVKSTPTIARWLNSHPLKENRDAPILISLKKSTFDEPLRYAAANKRLKRICEKARKKHPQFTKRIYLTLMQLSRLNSSQKE